MHIAWLGKKSPFCGNVTYGREITNALLERGYRVSFFHFAQDNPHQSQFSECEEVSLPCIYHSQIYTIPSPKSSKVLTDALKRLKPDLVHASLTLSPLDFLLPEICEELKIPLVATFHPPFDHKLRNFTSGTQHLTYQVYAPFLAHYHRVIVFSNLQKDLLTRLGVPADKVVVIPNGVDPQKYSPGAGLMKQELAAERLFIYQGRIAPEKNIEALLKAWKRTKMGDRAKLAIVGNGPLLSALMPAYGADQGVLWMGFVAEERRRIDLLRSADIFILPSLVEGLSLSLLEAMACGVACLATDAGADGEVLDKGAGIVLDTHRVFSQLQTLLPILYEHPEIPMMLGLKARQRVLERYTLSHNITRLEQLYRQVLEEAHPYIPTLSPVGSSDPPSLPPP
ncbi:glycosyltransferase family 4 protein [Vacuolonema iberomarrocanum]|uniref:glycosyltransferase family 4 protein n=1 Tax=Vacuolonema iberomarrocanum TaxID=3454632 RepID=UPI0019E8BE41|nr:glycosyltransferase family 4 protein [filamentous cyanobacterium LEGE 07170]